LDPAKDEVLRRTTLDTEKMDQPYVMTLGDGNDLIALGDQAGWIYLLDKQKGKIIHSWQADEDSVIGLAFTNSDKLLVSMGENGMIKFWGIR
jgi:WD40 repeat protein